LSVSLIAFAQRCLDPLPIRKIHRNAPEQVEMACFVNDRELAHETFVHAVGVGGCFDRHHGLMGFHHPRIVGFELHGRGSRQHVMVRFVPPLFEIHAERLGKGFIEIQVPPLHILDPCQRRQIIHKGGE
jgi:hypothetical protein